MKKLIAVIICISLFARCTKETKDNTPSSLKNGLVAYYPFNGNANDESGNGNNGAVNGATLSADRFGIANKAYSFDGVSSFIDLSNNNLNNQGNSSRTVACWINPTSNSNPCMNFFSSGNGVTGSTSSNNGKTFNLRLNIVSSSLTYNLGFMGYGVTGYDYDPLNGTSIPINEWTHVAVTFSENTITLYVNGIKGGSGIVSLNTTGNSNYIGRSNHTDAYNYFNGNIDEVRLYNRSLTQEEISYLANN
jgi:hypothetical protein